MDNKKTEKKKFCRNEKLDIIQEYLASKKTSSELARQYGISSCGFISNWINSFNVEIKDSPIIDKKKLNLDIKSNLKSIEKLRNKSSEELNGHLFTKTQKYSIYFEPPPILSF